MTAATPAPWYAEGLAAMQAYEAGEGRGTDQRWVAVAKAVVEANAVPLARDALKLAAERDEARDALAAAESTISDYRDALTAMQAERDEARAERDQSRESLKMLGRITSTLVRTVYAAWIDCRRGDIAAVTLTLANNIEGYAGPVWNGTETGDEWWNRTEAADGLDPDGKPAAAIPDREEETPS
jgi:hypothetical protein